MKDLMKRSRTVINLKEIGDQGGYFYFVCTRDSKLSGIVVGAKSEDESGDKTLGYGKKLRLLATLEFKTRQIYYSTGIVKELDGQLIFQIKKGNAKPVQIVKGLRKSESLEEYLANATAFQRLKKARVEMWSAEAAKPASGAKAGGQSQSLRLADLTDEERAWAESAGLLEGDLDLSAQEIRELLLAEDEFTRQRQLMEESNSYLRTVKEGVQTDLNYIIQQRNVLTSLLEIEPRDAETKRAIWQETVKLQKLQVQMVQLHAMDIGDLYDNFDILTFQNTVIKDGVKQQEAFGVDDDVFEVLYGSFREIADIDNLNVLLRRINAVLLELNQVEKDFLEMDMNKLEESKRNLSSLAGEPSEQQMAQLQRLDREMSQLLEKRENLRSSSKALRATSSPASKSPAVDMGPTGATVPKPRDARKIMPSPSVPPAPAPKNEVEFDLTQLNRLELEVKSIEDSILIF